MNKPFFLAEVIARVLQRQSRVPEVSPDEESNHALGLRTLPNLPNRLTEDDIVWGNSNRRGARGRSAS
jgi:hypothetical protein